MTSLKHSPSTKASSSVEVIVMTSHVVHSVHGSVAPASEWRWTLHGALSVMVLRTSRATSPSHARWRLVHHRWWTLIIVHHVVMVIVLRGDILVHEHWWQQSLLQ